MKGDETLTITAINEVEHQHWCYALDIAVARLRKDASKTIVPPPHYPVHSGYLLCLDPSMKWRRKYLVLTEDSLFINEHRRVGFGTPPLRYSLVGSSCLLVPFVTFLFMSRPTASPPYPPKPHVVSSIVPSESARRLAQDLAVNCSG